MLGRYPRFLPLILVAVVEVVEEAAPLVVVVTLGF